MNAIEFQAKVTNGSILIPEVYRGKIKENVRVILLTEEDDHVDQFDMIDRLLTHPLDIKDFKPLSREEIYE